MQEPQKRCRQAVTDVQPRKIPKQTAQDNSELSKRIGIESVWSFGKRERMGRRASKSSLNSEAERRGTEAERKEEEERSISTSSFRFVGEKEREGEGAGSEGGTGETYEEEEEEESRKGEEDTSIFSLSSRMIQREKEKERKQERKQETKQETKKETKRRHKGTVRRWQDETSSIRWIE